MKHNIKRFTIVIALSMLSNIALALLLPQPSQAQVIEDWVALYNGPANSIDVANDVALDANGNVHVTGYVWNGLGDYDYATVKYDMEGNQLWENLYNGTASESDRAYAIAVDGDGNVYVTGESAGIGSSRDILTIKYDSTGNELWTARYDGLGSGPDVGAAIAVDHLGNVFVAGGSHEAGNSDAVLIKYDSVGNQLWVAKHNGVGNLSDWATDLALDLAGNAIVTGRTGSAIGNDDYLTIKYDSNGTPLWTALYNGDHGANDSARALFVDPYGNVHVTGKSRGSDLTNDDYATVKYDSNGTELWVSRYSGPGGGPGNSPDSAEDVTVDVDGNVYVTGYSMTSTFFDYATIKYDAAGNEIWVRTYDTPYWAGSQNDRAKAIAVDVNGNVTVTGQSHGYAPYGGLVTNDYATIQYDSDGTELWVMRYYGPLSSLNIFQSGAMALALDTSGNVFVTGAGGGLSAVGPSDLVTIKYTLNQPPVASAGQDQQVDATSPSGASVTLDGSGSYDLDEDDLTYDWSGYFGQISGVTPTVNLSIGVHLITLTVTDVHGAMDSTTVTLTVVVPDADGDGMPDYFDYCPNEDATGFDANEDGCIDSISSLTDTLHTLVAEGVISQELENSLISKIGNAERSTDKDNICAAVNQVEAFKNQVNAQRGNKINEEAADMLLNYADNLITQLLNQLPAGESCG